jgi:hypothetical protein
MSNRDIFEEVRLLGLPPGQFAITSSGPVGIRGMREINDADIIVAPDLYMELVGKYGEEEKGGIKKVVISPSIEVFSTGSFPHKFPGEPSVEEQIAEAEVIAGLPFVKLEYVVFFKQAWGRDKDFADLKLIEEWKGAQ